jgi:hypothetical protein
VKADAAVPRTRRPSASQRCDFGRRGKKAPRRPPTIRLAEPRSESLAPFAVPESPDHQPGPNGHRWAPLSSFCKSKPSEQNGGRRSRRRPLASRRRLAARRRSTPQEITPSSNSHRTVSRRRRGSSRPAKVRRGVDLVTYGTVGRSGETGRNITSADFSRGRLRSRGFRTMNR